MSNEINITNYFLLYTNDNREVKEDVLLRNETIWFTINQMAEPLSLFQLKEPYVCIPF